MTMQQIFKDPAQQAQFEQDGYIVLDLLSADEVAHLKDYYLQHTPVEKPSYGFHVSLDDKDRAQSIAATEELYRVLTPKVAEVFQDFQIFTASFVIKETNPKGVVPPHQDWTFVDESQYWSGTLWTPLVDVDMDNGCLGVIKGSHKFFNWPRCSPSPQFKTPLGEHMFTIFPYLQLVPMKAGQTILFDNRTIHGSPPNTTDAPRLAAGIGVTHKDAQLFHHYLLPNTQPETIEVFAIQREFFLHYNNGGLSDLHNNGGTIEGWESVAKYPITLPKFTVEEMQNLIKSHPGNVMNVELIEKLARLFNYNLDGTKKEEPAPAPPTVPQTQTLAHTEKRSFFSRLFSRK
jgi:ectoine hydroxylase-related dioxygenase (phytanoyl-CoA dioxygenase family)